MSPACASPITWETLVGYWAGDLGEAEVDSLEEHLLGCASCTAASGRVAAVTEAVRSLISPVIDRAGLARLRARGLHIVENPVAPGERKECVFPVGVDILLHRLGGLALQDGTVLGLRVLAESTRDVLFEFPDVPFDAGSGEVLVACQRHFAALPHDVLFEVSARDASGREKRVHYSVPHRYETA
jgi:hypothetical protein